MRTALLTPVEIDETSRKIEELGLVPPDTKLSPDGSFGTNMRKCFNFIAYAGERADKFSYWLYSELGIGVYSGFVRTKLFEYLMLLPPGHHMTPVQRIDAVILPVIHALERISYSSDDGPDLISYLSGVEVLFWTWNDEVKDGSISKDYIKIVQSALLSGGFTTSNFIPDGDWGEESKKSLDNALKLAREFPSSALQTKKDAIFHEFK